MKDNTMTINIKSFYQRHKAKIILLGVITVGVVVLIKSMSEKKEEIVEVKDDYDYYVHMFQGTEDGSGVPWTLDLPVDNKTTVEAALRGVMDDLNSEKYVDLNRIDF